MILVVQKSSHAATSKLIRSEPDIACRKTPPYLVTREKGDARGSKIRLASLAGFSTPRPTPPLEAKKLRNHLENRALPKDIVRPVFCGVFIARWSMTIVIALTAFWIVVVQFAIMTQFVAVLLAERCLLPVRILSVKRRIVLFARGGKIVRRGGGPVSACVVLCGSCREWKCSCGCVFPSCALAGRRCGE
eukprot:COSAG02_NODE_3301_length_6982_cov_81.442685_5_plen_190_part_00